MFIGAGVWTPSSGRLPPGAIPAGADTDGTTLYMIRAAVSGAQSLGKFSAQRGEAYVPYGGAEMKVTSFEVLCYDLSRNRPDSMAAAMPVTAPAPMNGPTSRAEEAIRASGLQPVLKVDFRGDGVVDTSPAPASVTWQGVSLGSAEGSTFGVFDGRTSVAAADLERQVPLQGATVMVRVNSAFSKTWQAILNSRTWARSAMHFQFRDRILEISIAGNNPVNADVQYPFTPGQWYEIVVTYDMRARVSQVYINGQKAGTFRYTAVVPYVLNKMDIGSWSGEDRFFDGKIAYVYVLNGVMPEQLVMSSFSNGMAMAAAPALVPAQPAVATDSPRFDLSREKGQKFMYRGSLNENSPIGADGASYVPVRVSGFAPDSQYLFSVDSKDFNPTLEVLDEQTMTPAPGVDWHPDQHFGWISTKGAPRSLLIRVKAAGPGERPRPPGAFTMGVGLYQDPGQ